MQNRLLAYYQWLGLLLAASFHASNKLLRLQRNVRQDDSDESCKKR